MIEETEGLWSPDSSKSESSQKLLHTKQVFSQTEHLKPSTPARTPPRLDPNPNPNPNHIPRNLKPVARRANALMDNWLAIKAQENRAYQALRNATNPGAPPSPRREQPMVYV